VLVLALLGCSPSQPPSGEVEGGPDSGALVCVGAACGQAEACTPDSCRDLFWPQWSMDSIPGQLQAAGEVVVDGVRGLTWQRTAQPSMRCLSAMAYCDRLVLAGLDDWRLPTPVELMTIVDLGRYLPARDATLFAGGSGVTFIWSNASLCLGGTVYRQCVSDETGALFNCASAADVERTVRCVRSGQVELPAADALAVRRRFEVGINTVRDRTTELEWMRLPSALSGPLLRSSMILDEARSYCDRLTLEGKLDWRLPTALELVSLAVDQSGVAQVQRGPSWDAAPILADPTWSSTPFLPSGDALHSWVSRTGSFGGLPNNQLALPVCVRRFSP